MYLHSDTEDDDGDDGDVVVMMWMVCPMAKGDGGHHVCKGD